MRILARKRAAGWVAIATCLVVIGGQGSAQARDGSEGVAEFFRNAFGIGTQAPVNEAPAVDPDGDRTLIVRPHHQRRPRVAKTETPKGPYIPVSIYEDKTLRRGDAVMTAQGMKIFMGSESLPYRDTDFVAISDADGLSKPTEKALLAIDRMPRT